MSAPKSSYFTTASYISGNLFQMRHSISQHFHLEQNNVALQKENIELRKSSSLYLYGNSVASTKKKDTLYSQQYEYIPGTIINSTTTKRNNFFTINIGNLHGVKKGMGVFSSIGVVGIIHNTSKHFSVVKSVLTKNINIDVLLTDVGASGMLKWDGEDPSIGHVTSISNDNVIPVGCKVVTRGGGGIFPRGLDVGTVIGKRTIEGEASWHIDIDFSQSYSALENIYVVKNLFLNELNTLQNQ